MSDEIDNTEEDEPEILPEQTPIQEFWAHNELYKACIFKDSEKSFRVHIYKWNEDITKKDEENLPLWENVSGPFVIESFEAAEVIAKSKLPLASGEITAKNIDENLSREIEETVGHANFNFLETSNYKTSFLLDPEVDEFVEFEPQIVLQLDDFYFVKNPENLWLSGFLFQEGVIRCWKSYTEIKQALLEIKNGDF